MNDTGHDIDSLEALTDGVLEMDPNGKVLYSSEKAAALLGGNVIGRMVHQLFSGDGTRPLLAGLSEARERPVSDPVQLRTLRVSCNTGAKDRLLDLIVLPAGERPEVVRIALKDVSGSSVLEEQYRMVNTRLKTLLGSINAGILVENERRKIILVNEDLCRMFSFHGEPARLLGRSASEELRRNVEGFQDGHQFWSRIDMIVSERRPVHNEELPLINGRTYERSYQPIFIDDAYAGHLFIYRDITDRKSNEQRIRQLARLSEENPGPIMRIDAFMRIVYSNQPAKTLLLGMGAGDVHHLPSEFRAWAERALEEGRTVESELKVMDGGVSLLCTAVPFAESRSVNLYIKDITERKRAEEAMALAKQMAEDSMRAKMEFTSRMNHELRTPLNAIIGFANLLAATLMSDKQKHYLAHLRRSAELLLSLVNDILDLARIEQGRIDLQHDRFNLYEFLENLRSNVLPLAESKHLALSVAIQPDVPMHVIGAERQFHQILLNLISNAIKFTDVGSVQIGVGVRTVGAEAVTLGIEVIDTGRGIPKDKIGWIFESFTQVHDSRSVFGGTGLGLTIVKNLTELLGGTIAVRSEEGKGSVFSLVIPFRLPSAGDPAPKEVPVPAALTPFEYPVSVLLVEDNRLNQIVAQSTFEQWGVAVDVASNGREAIELLSTRLYDCVFMDIEMDVMNGYEATVHIRTRMEGAVRTVPIVAMTAFVSDDIKHRSFESGMEFFVTKPFDAATVYGILKGITGAAATPTEVRTTAARITMEQIQRVTQGNQKYAEIMLSAFIGELPTYLERLRSASSSRHLGEVQRIEHSLKPIWEYFEQSEVRDLLMRIVEKIRSGADVTEELNRTEEIIDAVLMQLREIQRHVRNAGATI